MPSDLSREVLDAMREWVLERCAGRLTRAEVSAASPAVIVAFVHGAHPVGVSAFLSQHGGEG